MKKLFLINLFLVTNFVSPSSLIDMFTNNKADKKTVIASSDVVEKQNKLELLESEKEKLENNFDEFKSSIQSEIDKINTSLKSYNSDGSEKNSEITLYLKDSIQILNDTIITKKSIIDTTSNEIEVLKEYIKDPYFKTSRVDQQTYFSFDQMYNFSEKVFDQEDALKRLIDEKTTLESQEETQKKDIINLEKNIKEIEQSQKELLDKKNDSSFEVQLNEVKIQNLKYKKRLNELKVQDTTAKTSLVSSKIFIAKSKLFLLKKDLRTIERKLRVYETDIEKYNNELTKIREKNSEIQKEYNTNIQKISDQKKKLNEATNKVVKENEIKQEKLDELKNLNFDPQTVTEALLRTTVLLLEEELYNEKINYYKGEKDFYADKLENKEIFKKIILTWQKITQEKFKTEDELLKDKQILEDKKQEVLKDIDLYQEKINNLTKTINNKIKLLNTAKELKTKLNDKGKLYINEIEKRLENIVSTLSSLSKDYSSNVEVFKDLATQLQSVITKLEKQSGNILARSEYAVSLKSLRSIGPELRLFASDIKNIIINLINDMSVTKFIENFKNQPSDYIYFLLKILLIIIFGLGFYFAGRKLLPYFAQKTLEINPPSKILSLIYELIGVILLFLHRLLISVIIWSGTLALVHLNFIHKTEFKILFYLVSIPYLCYVVYLFFNFLIKYNEEHNYSLISESFQPRFHIVSLLFSFSTVILMLFKKAFSLSTYEKTELPTILDVSYSIILRACIIFFIGKDEILSLIPDTNKYWLKLKEKIDQFYYLILISILILIIVSDPYIGGFGKLVSYVLWGILGSIILFGFLYWIQGRIRKASIKVFFSVSEDTTKERFPYAKTFYGIFVVLTLLGFIFVAIYFGAKIWGKPIPIDTIKNIFNFKLFSVLGENNQFVEIKISSLITVFAFIFGGILVAWVFDHFVLQRIFNILIVDSGIQNTVSSITTYLIFIIAAVVGLMRIGISGSTMSYLFAALAFALAFAIKNPANDFIAYFILLVERSIKIGDFVEFTQGGHLPVTGFVRKITPRTLVLRRKNSVTVVIPNASVINSTFYNWSYSNTFIAFDDILISITYNNDPEKVKNILLKILSENREVLKSPAPIVRLHVFDASGYTFLIRGFLSSVNVIRQWDIASDIRIKILKVFKEEKITIAVPIRHIISTGASEYESTSAHRPEHSEHPGEHKASE